MKKKSTKFQTIFLIEFLILLPCKIVSKTNLARVSFLLIFFASPIFAANASLNLAQNNVSTNDIIREIEKNLLFSDEEKSKMELLQNQLNQKSDFTIVAGNKDESKNEAVEIKMNEIKKSVNIDMRTKEKMAYNATLSGQYEVAIELYKQVIASEPNNNYALFSLAIIYQKVGQLRQAKATYYRLLQNNPENKDEVISNILSTLSEESPRDALYLLTRLAAAHPQSSYILVQTALAYSGVENYDKASELLRQAIALDPERLDYKYNLAINYDKAQNYEKAFAFYQEVIRNYRDNKFAAAIPIQAVQSRLETIKNKI